MSKASIETDMRDYGLSYPISKQTNADRIRNMTDEELADLLKEAEDCGYRDASITPITDGGYMDMLEWLQSEVKEGAE